MMWYSIVGEDVADSLERRAGAREAHLTRLKKLVEEGRLLVAGPNPAIDIENPGESGFTGSVIIAEFDSLSDAQRWADDDPYIAAGVYASVAVKPFKRVLP